MSEQDNIPLVDENHVIAERREKLAALRVATNGVAFPNDFKPKHKAATLQVQYGEFDKETLDPQAISATVAGRMMLKRIMGKASFATIQDGSGDNAGARIQLYIARDEVGEDVYEAFKHWDMGDFSGKGRKDFASKRNSVT